MATIRRSSGQYTAVSRALAQDDNLSFEAVGMMTYLLSKPDDWEAQLEDLERRGKIGPDKRKRIMAELEEIGYLERRRIVSTGGRFEYQIIVHETPLPPQERTALSLSRPITNTVSATVSQPSMPQPPTPQPSVVRPSLAKPQTAEPHAEKPAILDNRERQNREEEEARETPDPVKTSSTSAADSSSVSARTTKVTEVTPEERQMPLPAFRDALRQQFAHLPDVDKTIRAW